MYGGVAGESGRPLPLCRYPGEKLRGLPFAVVDVLLALTRLAIFLLISLALALLIALALLALLVLVALRGVVRVGLLSGLFCIHSSPFISSIGRTGLPEIIAGRLSPPWSIRFASLNSKLSFLRRNRPNRPKSK
jgi:hypothetical protein